MKIDFLKGIDIEKTDAATVELLKGMGSTMEKAFDEYLNDVIDKKKMEDAIADAIKGIDNKEELKSVKEQLSEVKNVLVRMKGSMERNEKGELVIKSVADQLKDQLKDYINVDAKGVATVDLKAACENASGKKLKLNLLVKDASTVMSGALDAAAPHMNVEVDKTLGIYPRSESIIRKYANVSRTNSRSLIYAEYVSGEGDAAWVEEGGLKPLMDATLNERTVTAAKIAIAAKFTEETLMDFPSFVSEVETEMLNKLGLKEEDGILYGTGQNGELKGVAEDMPAYSLVGYSVTNPNYFDALVGAYTQIVSVSEMSYRPNLVLMNPIDYAQMQMTKDANGNYLRPFRSGDELIQNLRVETSTRIGRGEFIMGDFNYLNVRDLMSIEITMGWENDDFRRNIVTVLTEKRLMTYIKAQYKTAFVKDSFDTVLEVINRA